MFFSLASMNKYGEISQAFDTCNPVTKDTLNHLYGWVRNSFTDLAMMNYPYPTNFLAPLPGYPVNVSQTSNIYFSRDLLSKCSHVHSVRWIQFLPNKMMKMFQDSHQVFIMYFQNLNH